MGQLIGQLQCQGPSLAQAGGGCSAAGEGGLRGRECAQPAMLCFTRPLAPYAPPSTRMPSAADHAGGEEGPVRPWPRRHAAHRAAEQQQRHCQSGNKDVEAQMRRWQELWCGEANRALSSVSSKVRELPLVFSLPLIAILWLAS
jgi:hypothetical protein